MARTVAELFATLSMDEFEWWLAYHQLEPWGTVIEDHRWQTLCDLTYRAHFKPGKDINFFERNPTPRDVDKMTDDERLDLFFSQFPAKGDTQ